MLQRQTYEEHTDRKDGFELLRLNLLYELSLPSRQVHVFLIDL